MFTAYSCASKSSSNDKYSSAVTSVVKSTYSPIKKFLSFFELAFSSISAVVIGKRVNRGAGDGLEIPVEYRFFGDKRAVSWAENQVKKKEQILNASVNKCMK